MASASASTVAAASSPSFRSEPHGQRQAHRLVRRHRARRPGAGRRQGRQPRRAQARRASPCRPGSWCAPARSSASSRRSSARPRCARAVAALTRRGSRGASRPARRRCAARCESAPLPRGGRWRELTAAHATLLRAHAGQPVAVRSSATTEDSADASFAGLQDTYLWVTDAARDARARAQLLGEPVLGAIDQLSPAARVSGRARRDGGGGADHGGCAHAPV